MLKSRLASFLAGVVAATSIGALAAPAAAPKKPVEKFSKLDVFARVLSYVETNYVEDVDDQQLVYGAVKGMIRTLDPHSAFMTPEEYTDMRADTDGEFGGIGIEIDDDEGVLVVVEPIGNGPAARAGLLAGDRIVTIDGQSTKDAGKDGDTSNRLRGKPGTPVTIEVERKGWDKPHPFTLTRELIHVDAVDAQVLEPGIGYIKIKQFQERTDEEVEAALEKLKAQSPAGVQGVILDLRGNPGGLLDQAVKIADLFITDGTIVTTVGRAGKKLDEEIAKAHGTWEGFPMVCLVNGGSASASEIVAGALQDHERAVIVGTQTFGKGSVQSVYEFPDGSGLKLTVARYFTPKGRSIQDKGITPDVVVEQLDAEKLKDAKVKDGTGREADLQNHLTNPQGENADSTSLEKAAQDLLDKDFQLRTAFQTLASWSRFEHHASNSGGSLTPRIVER
jgi:carboxyl-terminal processing protease